VAFFKASLASGNVSLLSTSLPGARHRIADIGRYSTISAAFGRELLNMATGWYHPILPLIALGVALKFDHERHREVAFCGHSRHSSAWLFWGIYPPLRTTSLGSCRHR